MEIGSLRQSVQHVDLANPAVPVERTPEHRDVIEAVKAVNQAELLGNGNELTFVFDRETKAPLLRIVNRETREVVRQIPAEYLLRLAKQLKLDNSLGHRG